MGEGMMILRGREIGQAHLPTDADMLDCLRRLGAPGETLSFRLASEFKAPGVFEQYHYVAGTASAGAIKVEEEERGAGDGFCYYLFCKERGLEIYLDRFSGRGGELAWVVQSDSRSAEVCTALSTAMGGVWPTSNEAVPKSVEDRVAIIRQRLGALRSHVEKWFPVPR
jgi:hypothetical protein